MDLSKRLQTVADFVDQKAKVLADIGSDHAYLPIYLLEEGRIERAIAGEVIPGPFNHAKEEVRKSNFSDQIDVRLADGLEAITLDDSVDVITICGMGGDLIAKILDRGYKDGRLSGKEQLILQANMAEDRVRKWLMEHSYQITKETVVEDNKRIYEVICAHKTSKPVTYSSLEINYGPYILEEKSHTFVKKWTEEKEKLQAILDKMNRAGSQQNVKRRQFELKVKEIEEMITRGND